MLRSPESALTDPLSLPSSCTSPEDTAACARCQAYDHIFVADHQTIRQGSRVVGRMISKTLAKRTANALNRHTPNKEGV